MPTFQYKALQANGTMTEGRLDAPGRPDALRQMETLGLRPINLAETAAMKSKSKNGAPAKVSAATDAPASISFKFEAKKKFQQGSSKISHACFRACLLPACR
jgi:type II secretory pathway component PulF